MKSVKSDLISRITQLLIANGCLYDGFPQELEIVLGDYDVGPKSTELAVIDETGDQVLIRKFMTAKIVKGLSNRTLVYYGDTIRFFLDYIHKSVTEVTSDDIRLYIAMRRRRDGVSDVTAGNELRNLRSFYNWLFMEELIRTNPIAKVEPVKRAKVKKEAYSEYEIELIRNACRTSRERSMVEILLSTGCRVGELVRIRREELTGESVTVHGKGNKDRTVYLTAKSVLTIQEYLKERKDDVAWLFPKSVPIFESPLIRSVGNRWYQYPELIRDEPSGISSIESMMRKIGKRAGLKNVHPHRFRRTCATMALRRGMPIEQVSQMLGHEQISTTQIYLDLSERDLEQAHRKYVT